LERLKLVLLERGGLIGLAAALLYVWIAPTTITGGDNGEFATLGSIGGVAHPSGYPLYLLWLRIWSWLPAQSPAHATALATVMLAIALVLVLHAACRAWGARPLAATMAVAIYAASPLVMQLHTEAEVFALNGVVVAAVLWLSAERGPLTGTRRVMALALVAGLGLSNHSTCVLVTPVGLLGVMRGFREGAPATKTIVLALVALMLGLLPYVYLLVTWQPQLAWTKIESFAHLVHHFLRKDYGSSRLTSEDTPVDYPAQLAALARSLAVAWLWLPLAGGLCMLAYRSMRRCSDRWAWRMLGASFLLAGPVLLTRFNLDPVGSGLFVCERFHLLPILLLAIPVACAFELVLGHVRISDLLGSTVAVVAFAAIAGRSLPHHMRAQSPAIENAVRGMLDSVPANAVVIVAPESLVFGLGYAQDVLRIRKDVTVIAWPMMRSPEYRERLWRRSGLNPVAATDTAYSITIAEQVLAHGRPLYIDAWGGNIARAFATYPYGMLFRVLPKDVSPPTIDEVFEINRELFAKFDFRYPKPTSDDYPAAGVQIHLARAWSLIADGLRTAGSHDAEAIARANATELAP